MRVSAKADYAVRALVELAGSERPLKAEEISERQSVPLRFLGNILGELHHAGLVRSQRGPEGGYWLAKPAEEITIADVMRGAEGPLATVRGEPPETLEYSGAAEGLQGVWIALRTNLRAVVEVVTIAHVAKNELPASVEELAQNPDSWLTR